MSGSTIGGFAGAAIGFFFGGPVGAQWGFMLGSVVGGYVDPQKIEGPRLTDAQTQTSNEGVPRPIVYGTAAVAGNIIQCGPLVEHKESARAGKGGPVQTTYTYTRTVAIRICEAAPLGGDMKLRRVWKDDKLVFDATGAGHIDSDSAVFASILTFYSGAEDQLPDPSLEALPTEYGGGVGNVPSYRGSCYAVLTDLDCTDRQGAVPQFRWEVSSTAVETQEVCYPADWIVGGGRTSTQAAIAISADAVSFTTINESFSCFYPVWHGNEILMGTSASARFSADNGLTFSSTTGISGSASTTGAAYCEGTWLVAKDENKVYHSIDGINFTGVSIVGTGGIYSGPIAVMGSRIMVAGDSSAYSDDGGATWTTSASYVFDDGRHTATDMDSDGTKFIAATDGNAAPWNHNIFKNTTGNTWEPVATPFTSTVAVQAIAFDAADGRWGAFCGNDFAYSANGDDWMLVANALPSGVSVDWQALAGYGGTWVAGGADGEIYSSLDGGLTWAVRSSGLDYIAAGVAHNGEPMQGIEFPDAPGFFVTTDGVISQGCTPASFSAGTVPLSQIVADLCSRGGIEADQIDVSALAGIEVRGYPIGRQSSPADSIKPLQDVFDFDFPEWGNSGDSTTKLRAVLRGGSIKTTITDDDIVDNDQDDDGTRAQQVEFPRKVTLTFSDPDANYEPASQVAERTTENIKAVGETQISTNVVLNRTEGAQAVEKLLKRLWEESLGRITRELPEEFSQYTPSDPVSYMGKRWRIEKAERADGTNRWDMVRDRASSATSTATGSPVQTPTIPVSTIRGPTVSAFMNLPSLRSADNVPGMYVAVQGLLPGWAGADIYLSADGGATEQKVATILTPSVMGELATACDADGADSSGLLEVQVYTGGALDSITEEQMAARMNGFALITDDVSEIGQSQNATENSTERLYDLTNVLRGQLGTTAASHSAGDRFVLLDGNVVFVPLDAALSGQTLIFRAVSIGTAPANNSTVSIVFDPPVFIRDGGVVTP